MNFLVRSVLVAKFPVQSSAILLESINVNLQPKRFVFNEEFLKIKHFRKEVAFHERRFLKQANSLRKNLSDCVSSQSVSNLTLKDLNTLLFLCKSQQNLELVVDAIKLLLKNGQIPNAQLNGLGIQLARICHILDLSELGLKLINDQDLIPIMNSTYARLILMNKLMTEKKYTQVVDLFEKYNLKDAKIKPDVMKSTMTKNKFLFAHDQFILVSLALLELNSKDSLERMKKIVDGIRLRNLEFVNPSLSKCFLLAIKQNDAEYAFKLTSKFQNLNVALGFNLSIIALSKLGFVERAMGVVKNLLDMSFNPEDNSKFEGRFFPYTITVLKEQIARDKNKQEYSEKLNIYERMIKNDGRYLKFDLEEYCKTTLF